MAPAGSGSPTWRDSLRNILRLEESRGFDDRAVVGGLDKFLQRWSSEMAALVAGGGDLAEQLTGRLYNQMSPEERRQWASGWQEALNLDVPKDASPPPLAPAAKSGAASPKPSAGVKGGTRRKPPSGLTVDSPVTRLRGVDTKTAARLAKLDVATVRDLLYLFPRRHADYSNFAKISELSPGEECTVVADVWDVHMVTGGRQGKRKDTEAVLSDETGNIRVIWFGQRYLARTIKPNTRVAVSGKPDVYRGQLVLESPEYELLDQGQAPIHVGRLVPVYPLTDGLTGRNLRRITWQALQEWLGGVDELLPDDLLDRAGLMPLADAIQQAHFPEDEGQREAARMRLAFDELFTLQLAVLRRKKSQNRSVQGIAIGNQPKVAEGFLSSLPFQLTGAQKRCIEQIDGDLERGTPPMNRLLQGEVGSGKTVVALAALLKTAAVGYQGAVMAPTEVLAEQHFQTVSRLLGGMARPLQSDYLLSVYLNSLARPVSVGLLTGSTRASRKRELTEMAANGTLDLLIGTHALIQEGVSLPKLALAVADEQHRFGVLQRSALRQRGLETPHTLIMSATPIPRTLTLTLYGDLDISTIDELPAGRETVATRWLGAGTPGGGLRLYPEAGAGGQAGVRDLPTGWGVGSHRGQGRH